MTNLRRSNHPIELSFSLVDTLVEQLLVGKRYDVRSCFLE